MVVSSLSTQLSESIYFKGALQLPFQRNDAAKCNEMLTNCRLLIFFSTVEINVRIRHISIPVHS